MTVPTAAPTPTARQGLARRCRAVTEARPFALVVLSLILGNAVLLGLETYPGVVEHWHRWLRFGEHLCIGAFAVEILLRLGAHADRPRDFLRDPWNLFDLAVVVSGLLPVVNENTTLLRLLRLARVLRTARFLPQLRVLLVAVGRSLPGTVSFLLVGGLLLYVYAIIGWIFFARADPEHFGSLGRAVLTLLLLMTLDGLGDAVHAGLEISRWSVLYYGAYVLMASFVLVNVLIGVVINSLEEARELEREAKRPKDTARLPGARVPLRVPEPAPVPVPELRLRIETARRALDDLERSLAPAQREPRPGARSRTP